MSTFDGYFREFDGLIRADHFGQRAASTGRAAQVHLLSHAHSDHMQGLNTFSSDIYCSAVTRELVLQHCPAGEKILQAAGHERTANTRTYSHLAPRPNSPVNLLRALPLLTPTEVPLNNGNDDHCLLTLISANHCPGSVMFLIQMWGKSVLYTGDIRAEPWWVESLLKEPLLAPFLGRHQSARPNEGSSNPHQPLDNIYLDTSGLLRKKDVLTKEEAILQTIRMMSAYPSSTIFFINAWTWGYEELLERISMHFKAQIHVDRYKFGIYSQPFFKQYHPLLAASVTLDPQSTRFHACERLWRCDECWGGGEGCVELTEMEDEVANKVRRCAGKHVVRVQPCEMHTEKWNEYKKAMFQRLRSAKGEEERSSGKSFQSDPWLDNIRSPFVRHSSFSELHRFVSIFKPRTLFPNTTEASLGFVEYHVMPVLFASALHAGGAERLKKEALEYSYENQQKAGSLVSVGSQVLADLLSVTVSDPLSYLQSLTSQPRSQTAPMDVVMVSQDHEVVNESLQHEEVVDKIFEEYKVLCSQYGKADDFLNEVSEGDEEAEIQAIGSLNALNSDLQDVKILDQNDRTVATGSSRAEVVDLTDIPDTMSPPTPPSSSRAVASDSSVDNYTSVRDSSLHPCMDASIPLGGLSFESSNDSVLINQVPSHSPNNSTTPSGPSANLRTSVDHSTSSSSAHLSIAADELESDTSDDPDSTPPTSPVDTPPVVLNHLARPDLDRLLCRESHILQGIKCDWENALYRVRKALDRSNDLTDEVRRAMLRLAVVDAISTNRQWNTVQAGIEDIYRKY